MITDRERKLMLAAYGCGFEEGVLDVENGFSNRPVKNIFEEWMNTTVADNGGTVEQLIDYENT